MHLSKSEKTRFYNTMVPLLHYVNLQKNIVPEFPERWHESNPPDINDVTAIRKELWQDNGLIDAFVEENPAGMSQDDLALAFSWKHYVADQFYILRHLKNFTVFLDDVSAYAVIGISDSLKDMIGNFVPLYVDTVLIPFEGRIIYDGVFIPYRITFGSGIKSSLNDTYRRIQEREGIITDLEEVIDDKVLREKIVASNKKVFHAFEKHMGKTGLSAKKMIEHRQNVEVFAKDFMLQKSSPDYLLDVSPEDIEAYLQTKNKVNRVSLKRFIRFLRDTYRTNYDIAEECLASLAK